MNRWQPVPALLDRLRYQPNLPSNDRLEVLYYLILQDRMAEAIHWFQHIDREEVSAPIAYDYARAWLACSRRCQQGTGNISEKSGH